MCFTLIVFWASNALVVLRGRPILKCKARGYYKRPHEQRRHKQSKGPAEIVVLADFTFVKQQQVKLL